MKRFLIGILAVLALLMFSPAVFAAGTWSDVSCDCLHNTADLGENQCVVIATFIADASDGSVPDLVINTASSDTMTKLKRGFYLYSVETIPGTPGPTDDTWDVSIFRSADPGEFDLMEGALSDRDSTETEVEYPDVPVPVTDNWTISVSGNAVNSATATIRLTFVK